MTSEARRSAGVDIGFPGGMVEKVWQDVGLRPRVCQGMCRLIRWCCEHGARLVVGAGILASAGACAASHKASDTVRLEGREQSDAEVYMPLDDGVVYTYETTSTDGAPAGLFTVQVLRPTGNRVTLKTGGKTRSVEVGPDGIRLAAGGYLLRAPVQKGRVWTGENGSVEVKDVAQKVRVPAGTFSGCIRTLEAGERQAGTITTVYCPRVGIVSMDVEERTGVHRVARLKSQGPRVDVLPAEQRDRSEE